MVHKITPNKSIFLEALIVTVLIFLLGFTWGFALEYYRTSEVIKEYKAFEIEALDLKLQNYYYQIMDEASCDEAIEQNFIFADNIYDEGLRLEKFEEANQLTDELKIEKKRYVLLKTELWLNTILLKKKCNADFHTVVYLYENEPSQIKESEQKIISNVLEDLKKEQGNNIILLPIAGNLNLNTIELQKRIYEINELPSLIIDEKTVLEGFHTKEEIESHISA